MLRLLAPLVASQVLRRGLKHQNELGYKLEFKNLPLEWINGYALADMTTTWRNYGLPISGLNYFTLGSVKQGISTRFTPGERLYQAWLGGYIFRFDKPTSWKPKDYMKLAEADQKKWLWYYGAPAPRMDFGESHKVANLAMSGINGKLFAWTGITQSDVGVHSRSLHNRVVMDGMAYIMNRLTPNLRLQGKQFIPRHEYQSYEELAISGYVAIMDIRPDTKAVLYVCMSEPDEHDDKIMKQLITRHLELRKL